MVKVRAIAVAFAISLNLIAPVRAGRPRRPTPFAMR